MYVKMVKTCYYTTEEYNALLSINIPAQVCLISQLNEKILVTPPDKTECQVV